VTVWKKSHASSASACEHQGLRGSLQEGHHQAGRDSRQAHGGQARYHRLVRRFGGPKNRGAVKKAILGIAHTLLKIAYEVLRSGKPYQDLGADFYSRREPPEQHRAYLLRQLEKLRPPAVSSPSPPRRLPDDPPAQPAWPVPLTAGSLSRAPCPDDAVPALRI
jgi:hypothetical protein